MQGIGEKGNPRSTETPACRTEKLETARPANTGDNEVTKDKCKIIINRNQGNITPSEPSSPTTANSEYAITSEKQELDLKSHLILPMEDFKKDINNSLKEIQENMDQQVETIKGEGQKSLKEIQENMDQKVEVPTEETQNSLKEIWGWAVVVHAFNPSSWEAEAERFLSSRPAWSTE